MDDAMKNAYNTVNSMSNNNANKNFQKYDNYREKVNATAMLDPTSENIDTMIGKAEELARVVNEALKGVEDQNKEYAKMVDFYNNISAKAKDLKKDTNDASKNSGIIKDLYKELHKNQDKLGKGVGKAVKDFLDANSDLIETALDYEKIMNRASQTLKENLKQNLGQVKDEIIKLSNAFNLQKLVTGGASLNDLRNMQGNFKINMNLDTSGFMGVQKELISQNKAIADNFGEAYLTFSDATNYMSNISDYSLKNYNQSVALYKQITIGNKYLNLSNQSLSGLVKTQNALADDSFMNKQLALISALGTDSAVSEDLNSLVSFIGTNAESANARYGANTQSMLTSGMGIKLTSDALLGSQSGLIDNMMAEIMGSSDFSQLSGDLQTIFSYAGVSNDLIRQMQEGNVDMEQIIVKTLQGLSNLNWGQRVSLEQMGLKDYVTLSGNYTNNEEEFLSTLNHSNKLLENIDVNDEKQLEEIQKQLAGQNDNRTFFEEFQDKVFTTLGIQDQNWTALLGIVQMLQTGITAFTAITSLMEIRQLIPIKAAVLAIAAKQGFTPKSGMLSKFTTWAGASSGMTSLVGGHALSNGAVLGAGASIVGGVAMGVMDGIKTKDWEGGWARGAFLGTGHSEASSGENTASVLGNAAKYALVGAGIGTFIGGPIGTAIGAAAGGLLGGALGLFGAHMDANTEAVDKNTKTLGESRDSIVTGSYISKYVENDAYTNGSGGTAGYSIGYGSGAADGNYPWTVTSPFGNRTLSNGDSSFHNGMDFGIKTGTPIGAPVSGVIQSAVSDNRNTYPNGPKSAGSGIYLLGSNGILYQFWHLSSVGVKKGQQVTAGQTIGLSGNTGYSTGPHLHFGTKVNGNWQNPVSYLTSGLFEADGKTYAGPNASANATDTFAASSIKYNLAKSSTLSAAGGVTDGTSPGSLSTPNYATSADIDRLIETINTLSQNQSDQKDFLRALAGKNTFVYGRE